jgi:transposase
MARHGPPRNHENELVVVAEQTSALLGAAKKPVHQHDVARTLDSTTKEAPFGDAEDVLCERRGRILERIVKRCTGLDVHKASVTACVRLATTASEGEEPHQQRQIQERAEEVQRLEKVLQEAGIKLSSVATRVLGASGRAMIEALLSGTTDPKVLAELAKGRLRKKIPKLEEALEGNFSSHHAFMVGNILAHIDYLEESIARLSEEIERVIAPFCEEEVALLSTIPGVDRRTAETLIAEIGVDMSRFPSSAHLASWAGMCPGNEESAGKRRSGKTRKGSKWLRSALTESAHAAARTKGSYLSAQYGGIRGRRGSKKAAVAVGHSILVIAYHLLERKVPYEDLGEDYLHNRRCSREARTNRLVRKLERLGHKVVLEPLVKSA